MTGPQNLASKSLKVSLTFLPMTFAQATAVHVSLARQRFWRRPLLLVAVGSTLLLLLVEAMYWLFGRSRLYEGFYFEPNSSEDMMATIELQRLVKSPIRALFYLHTQPPGFDFVRLLLSMPELLLGRVPSIGNVDLRLLIFQAVLFGLLNAVVFYWVAVISSSRAISCSVTLMWAMYPGNLFVATFLDSMYLSTFLFVVTLHFWFLYFRCPNPRWLVATAVAVIALAWTRPNIQPVFIPIVVVPAVFALRHAKYVNTRRLLLGAASVCLVALLLPIKQFILFGTPSSSTVSGHHLLGMIRYLPTQADLESIDVPDKILNNGREFESEVNNVVELQLNYKYSRIFFRELSARPLDVLEESLTTAHRSLVKGAGATHAYQRNVLVEDLPWADASARVFSGTSYAALLTAGTIVLAVSVRRRNENVWRDVALRASPAVLLFTVLALTIVFGSLRYTDVRSMGDAFGWSDGFTWTESNRYKFMLEPVLLPPALLGLGMSVRRIFRFSQSRWS